MTEMLRGLLDSFRRSEYGQDISEYCLITALVALVALGIFIHASGGVQSIWGSADATLATTPPAAHTTPGGGTTPAVASGQSK